MRNRNLTLFLRHDFSFRKYRSYLLKQSTIDIKRAGIKKSERLAHSPELNPIELVWNDY